MIPLVEIYCFIDDFCKIFELKMQKRSLNKRGKPRKIRRCSLSLSEIITILAMFQLSHYKTFKDFYCGCLVVNHKQDFHRLISYNRFVELTPRALMPLLVLLLNVKGKETGRYYVDSTKLSVCDNLRIARHKVFKNFANRGKTSTGWFFGFKLHIVINDRGEIMSFRLTSGNVDDRRLVTELCRNLKGWLFGDRGYISKKLANLLQKQGLELITNLKKTMKKQFLLPIKKYLLSKRRIIETVIGQLKAIFDIDHTRHRSVLNFQVNILAGLLAYVFKPRKPGVSFDSLNDVQLSIMSN